jgi:hypothetical protein
LTQLERREVEVKPLAVPRVERLPDGLSAMRIEVIPNHVHLFARIRSSHALHEGDQIVLGTPIAALCQPGMHIERGNQRLGAMADIFEFATTAFPAQARVPGACARWPECQSSRQY